MHKNKKWKTQTCDFSFRGTRVFPASEKLASRPHLEVWANHLKSGQKISNESDQTKWLYTATSTSALIATHQTRAFPAFFGVFFKKKSFCGATRSSIFQQHWSQSLYLRPRDWPIASPQLAGRTKRRPSDNNAGAAASAKKGNLKLSRRLLSDGVSGGGLMTNPLPRRGGKSMANKTDGFTPPLGLENSGNSEGKPWHEI